MGISGAVCHKTAIQKVVIRLGAGSVFTQRRYARIGETPKQGTQPTYPHQCKGWVILGHFFYLFSPPLVELEGHTSFFNRTDYVI